MNGKGTLREERTEVLIVGGGLVGLSAALFLAQHGVRAKVVEKHAGTALHPRARGFHAPTIELFHPSGLADEIERVGATLRPDANVGMLTAVTLAGPVAGWKPFDPQEEGAHLSPRPTVAIGQDRLEPMIRDAARKKGADIRFGHELVSFSEARQRVLTEVVERATGERYRIAARYLIAADGARSRIREELGIARSGHGSMGHAISTLFTADLSRFRSEHPFVVAVLTHPEAGGVVVGTDVKDRWIYGTSYDPQRESPADFTEARWIARIRQAAGDPELNVAVNGTFAWEPAERVAERFAQGRIFLVGDAAHQMPPSGGHGANTGIQDAANLAWKLAAVLRGQAGSALLDSYDAERRPVAQETARQSFLLARRFSPRGGEPDPEVLADDASVVFGYRYGAAEPIPRSCELTGAPGTRAPHVWVEPAGMRVSTVGFFGSGWTLLAGDGRWCAAAAAVARATGVAVRAEVLDGWQAAYGVEPRGAVLVRPDGFVGVRWSAGIPHDPEQTLAAELRRLLCLPPR